MNKHLIVAISFLFLLISCDEETIHDTIKPPTTKGVPNKEHTSTTTTTNVVTINGSTSTTKVVNLLFFK